MKKLYTMLISLITTAGILTGCASSSAPPSGNYSRQQLPTANYNIDGTDRTAGQDNTDSGNIPERGNINPGDIADRGDTSGRGDTGSIGRVDPQFAINIFKKLNDEDKSKSVFISPLSISLALSMAYEGSGSATKTAMAKTLGYTGLDDKTLNQNLTGLLQHLKKLDSKVELDIGNSIWVKKGEPVRESFLKTNRDVFGASVNPLDFSQKNAADKINQWISTATKNRINNLISPPIPANVVMYLINAVYFKGDWTEQFDSSRTFGTQFKKDGGGSRDVMMMSRKGHADYGRGQDWKAVRLPYGSGKAAMYCILPDEGKSINDFISGLDADKWNTIKSSISGKNDVDLQIPRFKLEYGVKDLNKSLSALGMGVAFTGKADFTGIRNNVFISKVLHKAVIDVNEKGSEAAAATGVEVTLTSTLAQPLSFIADRPFIFIIADDVTGSILFMGKMYE